MRTATEGGAAADGTRRDGGGGGAAQDGLAHHKDVMDGIANRVLHRLRPPRAGGRPVASRTGTRR